MVSSPVICIDKDHNGIMAVRKLELALAVIRCLIPQKSKNVRGAKSRKTVLSSESPSVRTPGDPMVHLNIISPGRCCYYNRMPEG